MIKLEHVVLASPEQMEFIIQGLRNPMNSWENSDSHCCHYFEKDTETYCDICPLKDSDPSTCYDKNPYILGENDHSLMQRLANAGTDHRKFMRMMPVYLRITAPLYWWKEFDTYKVGTVANSCSTMHKIQEKEFTLEDFSCEHLIHTMVRGDLYSTKALLSETIDTLNHFRNMYLQYDNSPYKEIGISKKDIWWQMIQLLPSSYNQTRNVVLNYEVLANIYKSRRGHKLDEWVEFCQWIETLPYSELICGPDFNVPKDSIEEKFTIAREKED